MRAPHYICPCGSKYLQGYLRIKPGDFIFARPSTSGDDPMEDVFQVHVASRCVLLWDERELSKETKDDDDIPLLVQ